MPATTVARPDRVPAPTQAATGVDALVDATPASRDRVVDGLRGLSIMVVVLWHWVGPGTLAGETLTPCPITNVPVCPILIGVVAVVLIAAVGGFFVLTHDTSDPELTLTEDTSGTGEADLTLHGATQPVTIELTARAVGDISTVQGSAPIEMADYEIEPPSVGGFVTVSDAGSFEFIVNFEQA